MRVIIKILIIIVLSGCGAATLKPDSIEMITIASQQDSIFSNLIMVTGNIVPDGIQNDSLAFLVLPVQASCPSCRNKTIDSIVKHQDDLPRNHFIVISAKGGRKTINGYFQENNKKLPEMQGVLTLDSNNLAYKVELYDKKPVMYYTYNRKAYKKVAAIPATVKEDLKEFFSGHRANLEKK